MATFTNIQYDQSMLTVGSTKIIGAGDRSSDNRKWVLSIQGRAHNWHGLVINKGTDLFMGWDERMENVILSEDQYIWNFVIDWETNKIGFQVPGFGTDEDTFFTVQLEDDESTLNLVAQSGELTKMQQWARDPPLMR